MADNLATLDMLFLSNIISLTSLKMTLGLLLIVCFCKNKILFLPWEKLVQPKPKHPDHFCWPCLMRLVSFSNRSFAEILQKLYLIQCCWEIFEFQNYFSSIQNFLRLLLTRFYSLSLALLRFLSFEILIYKLRTSFFEFWNFYSL